MRTPTPPSPPWDLPQTPPDLYLHSLSYALGSETAAVEESEARGRTRSSAAALRRAGFVQHRIASAQTRGVDLARRALVAIRDSLSDTGALIYATCLPESTNTISPNAFAASRDVKDLMAFPASLLQAEFALERATVIGVHQQACTGMLGSLRIARALLSTEHGLDQVLCVSADRFPENALYEQSYNLISDGAAACVVSRKPIGFRILACHHIANGALARATDDEAVGCFFPYVHRLVVETLARVGWETDDLAWIVPQNTNDKAWRVLSRLLGVDRERVYDRSLPDVAHVISGDNVINLSGLESSGRLRTGDRILLVMAGYGMNWQCVALERV